MLQCFLYRRRADFGMLDEPNNSLNDADLLEMIRQIHSESPTLGVSMVSGRLRARGFKVARDRLRRVMRESDPLSAAFRWPGGATKRRPYSLPGPNSLWHMGKLLMHAAVVGPI